MPKCFFKTAEYRRLVLGFEKDNLLLGQSGLCQRRREQIGLRVTPQDLAAGTGRDPRCERCRCRPIYRSIGATGDLMKGSERKPARG